MDQQTLFDRPSTSAKVALLKEAGEDFEWYPTTDEIIRTVAKDIKKWIGEGYGNGISVIDIGAGDGRVLVKLQEFLSNKDSWKHINIDDKFAIEKSTVHLADMPKDIVVIGTEFREQTLVDKVADFAFCNPPYLEFEDWVLRIVRELPVSHLYFVVPKRWRDNALIVEQLKQRDADTEVLGEFTFENADRQARAQVEIVRIVIERDKNETFDAAIEEMLPELELFDLEDEAKPTKTREQLRDLVDVDGEGIIKSLVAAYDAELAHMYDTYRDVVKINPTLLKSLGVCKKNIMTGLRQKITSLKNKYWEALFEHLSDIKKKLATKQRKAFLESLNGKAVIDFTESNVYSMLIWIAKWASDHFDEQLVDLYKTMASSANVEKYKSNQKVFTEKQWRYAEDHPTHWKLCLRMVLERWKAITTSEYSFEAHNGLVNDCHDLLSDFITVANNLGFDCDDKSYNHEWKSNKKVDLMLNDGEPLMDVRAFKNGNMHIRPNKRFMLALNVQAGKLLGWLRTAREAEQELEVEAADKQFVHEVFAKTNKIEPTKLLRITGEVA